jgi:3-hydroxybutyryl-CoA dehydrogenase
LVREARLTPDRLEAAWRRISFSSCLDDAATADLVSETVWHIIRVNSAAADRPECDPRAKLIKDYVDKGWLGVKSGRGFYTYPDPAYAKRRRPPGDHFRPMQLA